jgi:hypothetical protein
MKLSFRSNFPSIVNKINPYNCLIIPKFGNYLVEIEVKRINYLLTMLMCLSLHLSNAQGISKDLHLKRSVRQENQTYQFKALESTPDNTISHDQKKFYYWFKSQAVVCTQGASSGQLLHGLFESFYDNKQLSSRGVFNKGLKHGKWIYWNLDGIIIRTESWDYGVKSGDEIHYNQLGKWMETIDYGYRTNERKTNDSIIITDKEGIRQKVQLLDSIGDIKQTIKYKNGYPVVRQKISDKRHQTKDKRHQTKDIRQETSEKISKKSDARKQSEGNFWKRLFLKKKKDSHSQQPPKKSSWKFWKKENSPKK